MDPLNWSWTHAPPNLISILPHTVIALHVHGLLYECVSLKTRSQSLTLFPRRQDFVYLFIIFLTSEESKLSLRLYLLLALRFRALLNYLESQPSSTVICLYLYGFSYFHAMVSIIMCMKLRQIIYKLCCRRLVYVDEIDVWNFLKYYRVCFLFVCNLLDSWICF